MRENNRIKDNEKKNPWAVQYNRYSKDMYQIESRYFIYLTLATSTYMLNVNLYLLLKVKKGNSNRVLPHTNGQWSNKEGNYYTTIADKHGTSNKYPSYLYFVHHFYFKGAELFVANIVMKLWMTLLLTRRKCTRK